MIELGDVGPDGTAFVEALPADPDEARELLEHTLARLDPKPSRLEYVLDVPHPEKQVLLERLGFELARVTRRWEWRRGTAMPAVEDRLRYRTVERGELEEAIARIAEHSLDRRLDPGEAQRQAALLLGLEHEPGWYELAFADDGGVVGLLAAARVQSWPIVALIGVVPEHRGRGHALRLLARATRHLAQAGAKIIRADTDVLNEPMAKAFRRAGYEQFATRSEYVCILKA